MTKNIRLRELAKTVNLSDVLIYRPNAAEMFRAAKAGFAKLEAGTAIMVDFDGIALCDASFVDEFIINLQLMVLGLENTIMVLTNCCEDVLTNIEAALALKNERDKSKLVLLLNRGGQYDILGKLEQSLRDTFDVLVSKKTSVTAREIAEIFDLPEINGASNRLRRLYDARLVCRYQDDDTRWQQVYYLPDIQG